nr:RNA-directed DNA polymerase, eukaryota, reverse transcriptase zinc-binding domain protein [Tanacetum cinerariifolium]
MDGLDAMLENGSWFIYNNPLIWKKWNPDVNLLKEDVGNVLVWVKFHGVTLMAFSEDGLSGIATKLELKYTIVVAMPKLVGKGFYTIVLSMSGNLPAKNLKKPSQAPKGVPVGPKVGFKPVKQVYRHVSKKNNANTSGNKNKDVESRKESNVGQWLFLFSSFRSSLVMLALSSMVEKPITDMEVEEMVCPKSAAKSNVSEIKDNHANTFYANALNQKLDNKLTLILPVVGDDGVEVEIFDDEIVKEDPSVCLERIKPTMLPLWVKFRNLPLEAWSAKGISTITIRLGNPLIMDQVTTQMCNLGNEIAGFARVLIEVEACKGLPDQIEIVYKIIDNMETRRKYMKSVVDSIRKSANKFSVLIDDPREEGTDEYVNVVHIEKDEEKAVEEFFLSGKLLGELNATLINLVLKVSTPTRVTGFRPIACCNVAYKYISKILTNRIKNVLNIIVDKNQSTFITERWITDNVLLTQELLKGYDFVKGPKRCSMMIDIQKAYDTVN